jgi:hypothetical protein
MKPAAKSLAISSSITLRFSSLNRHRRCFTGLESGLMFRECSMTSLGIHGKSEVFQAKVSWLARRKSASALSYLLVSAVPIRTNLLGSSGSIYSAFVSSVDLKVPDVEARKSGVALTISR